MIDYRHFLTHRLFYGQKFILVNKRVKVNTTLCETDLYDKLAQIANTDVVHPIVQTLSLIGRQCSALSAIHPLTRH